MSPADAVKASAPGPETAAMRDAYLELLALSLSDLAGAGTITAGKHDAVPGEPPSIFCRPMPAEHLDARIGGLDWPMNGLSMVGLDRLRDLRSLVEQLVADGIEGDLIEAGAWRGGATMMMRATLDSLGDERTVWVADSFNGFPEPGRIAGGPEDRIDLRGIDFLSVPIEQVAGNFRKFGLADRVRLVQGFFEDTMDSLRGGKWALVRLDGDTYDATRACLDALYPGLAVGGHVIIDDYQMVEECREAVADFRTEHSIDDEIVKIDQVGVRWRRGSEAGPPPSAEPVTIGVDVADVPDADFAVPNVTTLGETGARLELETARERLADAEKRLADTLAKQPLKRILKKAGSKMRSKK